MKQFVILSIWCFFACSNPEETKGSPDNFLFAKLGDRSYVVEFPNDYSETKSYRLLLAFHGSNGNGFSMKTLAQFKEYSKDYIFVYPVAATENWEEGCKCNKPYRLGIDDVGFVSSLIDTLQSTYTVSTNEVYAVGFSQGGLFTYNIACKLSEKIKAVAVVAAPMSVPLANDCTDGHNMNIMMIHGKSDNVLQYNGYTDPNPNDGDFSLLSSPATFAHWAKANNYTDDISITNQSSSSSYSIESYSGVGKGTVQLVSIGSGTHSWQFSDFNTSLEIIRFFKSLD
jgi:poly(3-hydroxybutyrate) depolymerase